MRRRFFEHIDTPEKAYWLGFIAADGSVTDRSLRVEITDKEHLVKLQAALGSNHQISPVKRGGEHDGCYILAVSCKEIASDLEDKGIGPRKTWGLEPWNGPEKLLPHYWRGMVDGDGWVTDEGNERQSDRWTVALCGNWSMVQQFRKFVEQRTDINVDPVQYPEHKYTRPFYHVAYTGTNYPQTVAELLYGDASVALDRKMGVVQELFGWEPSHERPDSDLSVEEAKTIVKRFVEDDELLQKDLAGEYGVERTVIGRVLHEDGWAEIEMPYSASEIAEAKKRTFAESHSGTSSHNSELSEEDVISIREIYDTKDVNQEELGDEYGVSQHCISNVVRGETYPHVEGPTV